MTITYRRISHIATSRMRGGCALAVSGHAARRAA